MHAPLYKICIHTSNHVASRDSNIVLYAATISVWLLYLGEANFGSHNMLLPGRLEVAQ